MAKRNDKTMLIIQSNIGDKNKGLTVDVLSSGCGYSEAGRGW